MLEQITLTIKLVQNSCLIYIHMSPFTACSAFQLLDDCGKGKGWVDASETGTGNWLKYVRSTAESGQQNLMAVQVQDKVKDPF